MMKILLVITISLIFTLNSFSQSIGRNDSIKVVNAINQVLSTLEKSDYEKFQKISTDKIYCILCEGTVNSMFEPYMITRKVFFDKYLSSIKASESYQRALKLKKIILIKESGVRSDITALITTFEKDEWKEGHEGEQFGIYFKKIKGEYKFSGIETIP